MMRQMITEAQKAVIRDKLRLGEPVTAGDLRAVLAVRDEELPPAIWEDLLYQGSKTMVYGLPKRHKTNWLIALTMAIAAKKPFMGRETQRSTVLYLSAEQKEWWLAERCILMMKPYEADPEFGQRWQLHYLKTADRTQQAIEQLVSRFRPGVLGIDPLQQLIIPEKEQSVWDEWLGFFDYLIEEYNPTLLLAHHARKKEATQRETLDNMISDMRGFGKQAGWVNNIIAIVRTRPREKDLVTIGFECRDAKTSPEDVTLRFNRETCLFEPYLSKDEEIAEWLRANVNGYRTATEVVKACAQVFGYAYPDRVWEIWSELGLKQGRGGR